MTLPIRTCVFLAPCVALVWIASVPVHAQDAMAPTVILVSLDGFRADYLDRHAPPTLTRIATEGVRAESLIPVFPTKTFPNHYTLVTGLRPARHGIVGNTIYDSAFDTPFNPRNRESMQDARWWGGEPLWVTLEKQGQIAAPFLWPGSEAAIKGWRPRYWLPYRDTYAVEDRIQWILDCLQLPAKDRPTFLTLYFSQVDASGHFNGPESLATEKAVHMVDQYLGMLLDSLESRGLLDDINLLITSDHGMAPTSRERVVFLDDAVNMKDIAHFHGDPALMVWPAEGREKAVLEALQAVPHVSFYRKSNLPEDYGLRDHRRIAPLVGIVDEGWRVSTRASHARNPARFDGGAHGYDHRLPAMQGIFLGHGPAFREATTAGPLSIVDLYVLMTDILGVTPAPNDGNPDVADSLLKPRTSRTGNSTPSRKPAERQPATCQPSMPSP